MKTPFKLILALLCANIAAVSFYFGIIEANAALIIAAVVSTGVVVPLTSIKPSKI